MSTIRDSLKSIAYVYLMLCVFFIPFQYYIFPPQQYFSDFLFGSAIRWIALSIFHSRSFRYTEISSDSASMYVLLLLLLVMALVISFLLNSISKWKRGREVVYLYLSRFFVYFLSLQLLKYGFDKIFKAQFYLPEPNTLYTPLGHLSKDILFWSTIGTSYSYNLFTGLAEVIPAILILFKRTRTVGLLWSTVVLLNVVAINFSFDISVKLYSIFLLLIAMVLLWPQFQRLYQFLVLQKQTSLHQESIAITVPVWIKISLQTFVIGILFLEALYPYLNTGNYNDDQVKRPYLHGAYEVTGFSVEGDTVELCKSPIKRFFIHRAGYFIVQNQKDEMQDFKLEIDSVHSCLILTLDNLVSGMSPYQYSPADSTLLLSLKLGVPVCRIKAKALNWKQLPALQNDFHWTIDQVK